MAIKKVCYGRRGYEPEDSNCTVNVAIKKGCYGRRGYEPEDSNCTVTWPIKKGCYGRRGYEPEDSNCTVTLRRSGRSKTKLTIEDEADVDKLQNGRNATIPDGFLEQN